LSADYNNIVGNEIVFILHRSVKFSNMKSFICPVVSAIVFGTKFLGSVASEVNVSPLNEVSRVEVDETIVSLKNKRTLQGIEPGIERISFSQVTKKSAKGYSETYAPSSTYYPSKSKKGTATAYPKKSKGSKTYGPTATYDPSSTYYPSKSKKGSKTYGPTATYDPSSTYYPSKSKKGSKTYGPTATYDPSSTYYPSKSKKGAKGSGTYIPTEYTSTYYPSKSAKGSGTYIPTE